MALSPTIVTAIIGGVCGLTSSGVVLISAHVAGKAAQAAARANAKATLDAASTNASPGAQAALNASFTAIVEEFRKETDSLKAYVRRLRGIIATMTEYIDALRAAMIASGLVPPPKPRINGSGLPEDLEI